jgi:thioredoxin-like negative regulator of GroEL
MNWLFLDKYFNLTLLAILGNLQPSSSAVLPGKNLISLYNSNDKITILTSQNFSSTIYNSNTAWLVEYYASWCGHCQSYANV